MFYGGNSNSPAAVAPSNPQFLYHQQQYQQHLQQQQLLAAQRSQLGSVNPHAVPLVKTSGVTPTPPPAVIIRTTTTEKVKTEEEEENIPIAALRSAGITVTTQQPKVTTESLTPEEEEEQAKLAYYNFGTSVHDTINDHEHVRNEVRDGLKLTGMYSYSDGFFKRTVHYVADENGYRVVNEEVTPINTEGPKFDPKGKADVKNTLAGDYSITVDDFRLNKAQERILKESSGV